MAKKYIAYVQHIQEAMTKEFVFMMLILIMED